MIEDKEADEEGNAMRYLENKTYDSKREMDILDAIDETQHLNKRLFYLYFQEDQNRTRPVVENGYERKRIRTYWSRGQIGLS